MDAKLLYVIGWTHTVHIAWSRLKMCRYIRFSFLDVNLQLANWVSLHMIVKPQANSKRKSAWNTLVGQIGSCSFLSNSNCSAGGFSKWASIFSTERHRHDRVQHGDVCKEVPMIPLCFFQVKKWVCHSPSRLHESWWNPKSWDSLTFQAMNSSYWWTKSHAWSTVSLLVLHAYCIPNLRVSNSNFIYNQRKLAHVNHKCKPSESNTCKCETFKFSTQYKKNAHIEGRHKFDKCRFECF